MTVTVEGRIKLEVVPGGWVFWTDDAGVEHFLHWEEMDEQQQQRWQELRETLSVLIADGLSDSCHSRSRAATV